MQVAIDSLVVMNWMLVLLAIALVSSIAVVAVAGAKGWRGGWVGGVRVVAVQLSIFALFALVLGVKGRWWRTESEPPLNSGPNRPIHFFFDMKYQPRYASQGGSPFFADGRAMRSPEPGTIPYDGTTFHADAGFHAEPSPDFLRADPRYYRGIADASARSAEGAPRPLSWEKGSPLEGYYAARVPARAIERAGGWDPLIRRGAEVFSINCAVCHGASGRGGGGAADAAKTAWGVTGASGMANIANLHQPRLLEAPDGEIFDTITNGKNTMSAYGHQVPVQDRWSAVAYLRVLQYAQARPASTVAPPRR